MLTGDLKQQKDLPLLAELKVTRWGYSTPNASTKIYARSSRWRTTDVVCSDLTLPRFAGLFQRDKPARIGRYSSHPTLTATGGSGGLCAFIGRAMEFVSLPQHPAV